MTIDLARYRQANKQYIRQLLDDKSEKQRMEDVGLIAAVTGCPIIAVCHFVGELWGFTPELTARIERLKSFYRITNVN